MVSNYLSIRNLLIINENQRDNFSALLFNGGKSQCHKMQMLAERGSLKRARRRRTDRQERYSKPFRHKVSSAIFISQKFFRKYSGCRK